MNHVPFVGGATPCPLAPISRPTSHARASPTVSLYNLESGFLEMLLQSVHRTLDPEEAGGWAALAGGG